MSKENVLNYAVVTGCFFIVIPVGIDWYYGNLSTYTNSYFRCVVGDPAYDISPEWLLSGYLISYTFGVLTVDLHARLLDIRWVLFVNTLTLDLTLLVTYFTVQHSVGLVLVTFMLCGGYTIGVSCMVCLKYAVDAVPKRAGLITSIINSANGVGGIFYNYVITGYINPDNVTPDLRTSNAKFFSQAKLLNKIPGVFIVIGVSATIFNSIGCVLVQVALSQLRQIEDAKPKGDIELTPIGLEHNPLKPSNVPVSQSNGTAMNNEVDRDKVEFNEVNITSSCTLEQPPSMTPSEVLRSKSFYLLWMCRFILSFCHLLYQNYYKAFAQLWIQDDTFLSSIGSFVAFGTIFYRLPCGLAIDRFGVKKTLISSLSVNTVLLAWWFTAPKWNRWLYFVLCHGLNWVQVGVYIFFPMAALKLYGPKYYATNYGLVLVATLVACFSCPVLFSFLQDAHGFHVLVLVGEVSSLFALMALVVVMPEDNK